MSPTPQRELRGFYARYEAELSFDGRWGAQVWQRYRGGGQGIGKVAKRYRTRRGALRAARRLARAYRDREIPGGFGASPSKPVDLGLGDVS